MSANPFVERLRDHAASVRVRPGAEAGAPDRGPQSARAVRSNQLAFWQSPIARAAINRRITGDPELGPETYFARCHGPSIVAPHVVSLRANDAKLEDRARRGRLLRACHRT